MRDNDKLKLKIKKILSEHLEEEEQLMVGAITVNKSSEDKRYEEIYRDEVRKVE